MWSLVITGIIISYRVFLFIFFLHSSCYFSLSVNLWKLRHWSWVFTKVHVWWSSTLTVTTISGTWEAIVLPINNFWMLNIPSYTQSILVWVSSLTNFQILDLTLWRWAACERSGLSNVWSWLDIWLFNVILHWEWSFLLVFAHIITVLNTGSF